MNAFRVAVLLFVSAVAASFAEGTNTLPTTITVDGLTYSNVTWRTVTPATVSIMHSTGAATIQLEKLPPELQKRFGYDPDRAERYRAAKVQLEAQGQQQDRMRNLRARDLRKIGTKLYDFAAVRQLLAQYHELHGKLSGVHGDAFDEQFDRVLAAGKTLARNADSCVLGDISVVQGDMLLVKDGRFEDYVYVMNYPGFRSLLEGQEVSAPALWTDNRDGKRVYDCGVIPNDDELLSLPVVQIDAK
jgi:ribosomal protein L20